MDITDSKDVFLVLDFTDSKNLIFSSGPYWKQKLIFSFGPYWQQKNGFLVLDLIENKNGFIVLDLIENKNRFLVLDLIDSKNGFLVLDLIESKNGFLVLDFIDSKKWIFSFGPYCKLKMDFALYLILYVTSRLLKIIALITIHWQFLYFLLARKESFNFTSRNVSIICRSINGKGREQVSCALWWHI